MTVPDRTDSLSVVNVGGRLRFFVTLLLILAGTVVVGYSINETIFDTLRKSHQQMLDRSVDQGVFLLESYLENQSTMLSLYASVPSVQAGRFSDLPAWLSGADLRVGPKRLAILNASGRGLTTTGQTFDASDRVYFQLAKAGMRNVAGPVPSRVDGIAVVVVAEPIPGDHPGAAVLTASFDLGVFRGLLVPVQGFSGAELTLTGAGNHVLATTSQSASLEGEILESRKSLATVPWTLTARVSLADFMHPVRVVTVVVGGLLLIGTALILAFFLVGFRHRRDLDQLREDRTRALKEAYDQIRTLAFHDSVTQLPNRNLVVRQLGDALKARRSAKVIVITLARFRSLTTTFGMRFGDQLLVDTATRLRTYLHDCEGSFLGKIGGSEFILLVDQAQCRPTILSDLMELFRTPMGEEDLRLHVNVHMGACSLQGAGNSPEEVIKSAETALWAAREKGPNEASELTEAAVEQRLRRAQLQKLLPEALERGELEVHYQPQVDVKTGLVAGYEALMRWTSPQLGAVGPAEFIPVAEETGFIVPLGYWILDQGIAFAHQLQERNTPAVVSVNASPVQFLHHDFLDEVGRRVEAAHLPARSLGLEITEGTLMEGIDQLRPNLGRIMAAGVKVSLDDFGTGYSSLNYLKELPLHVLKIDKGFIDAVVTDERAFHLIECIIDLAHHLGLVVVAEGVENQQQWELLAQIHCDQVQGYYTGRPRPAKDHLGGPKL